MKEKWNADNIGDLSGKVAIITGANTGIGKETARVMAAKGAEVILAVRSTDKGEKARKELTTEYKNAVIRVMKLDLSSLESISDFAKDFLEQNSSLHFLINNAGVMIPPYGKTKDGFELQFGTNHLGHFALTGRLIPLLKKTQGAKVTTVSSSAHNFGNLDFDDLGWTKRKYSPQTAYGDSKIANLYFTYELSRRYEESDIIATAAHPGWTATDLQRHSGMMHFLNPFFAQNTTMGALPTLRAATDPAATSGDYYGPNGFAGMRGYPVKVESNSRSHDEGIASKLWKVSEQLTGISYS